MGRRTSQPVPLERRLTVYMVFQERTDDLNEDVVRFQMPDAVYTLIQAEARRARREFNTVIRDIVRDDLTRRALAIRALNEQQATSDQ